LADRAREVLPRLARVVHAEHAAALAELFVACAHRSLGHAHEAGHVQVGVVDHVAVLVALLERAERASEIEDLDEGRRRGREDPDPDPTTGRMWNWQDAKIALEWLFYVGKVTTAARRNFERVYDLTERVIPAAALAAPAPSQNDAQRELVRIAARAQGVATERQLRTYFHLPAEHSKARVAELVETGELLPARIDGVPQRMYLWYEAREPRQVRARALLSPFDSLIWDRDRVLRLFDFPECEVDRPDNLHARGQRAGWIGPRLIGGRD
jgi:uncharacterized protein